MKRLTSPLIVVFLSTVLVMPAYSQIKKVAQTGLQFLKVDMVARSAAMGSAFSMTGSGADAVFYNPAGLSTMESKFDFFVTQTKWIADITYNAGALAASLGNWGNVGVSFIAADYGDIIGTRVAPTDEGFIETEKLDVSAYVVGLSYGRRLTNKFMVGGQVKYAYQHLGENIHEEGGKSVQNEVTGLAYDFGTIFYPGFRSFRLGMNIRNFSQQFKYESETFQLPLTFVLGFAMDVFDLIGDYDSSLLLSIDAIHPRDYTERIHIGAEYLLMNMLALRGGYKINYNEESYSFGFGLTPTVAGINLKIDYAYSDLGIFENISRFSVGLAF